jgi:hypothetical protein
LNYKSFNLPRDINIFLIIVCKIIYFRLKVNKIGYNTILGRLEGNSFTGKADNSFFDRYKKFYKASSFFLIKIFKDPNPCMIRSLILYELCSKYNIKVSFKTGVRKNVGALDGHSWLEIDGEPINENKEFLNNFTVVYEI